MIILSMSTNTFSIFTPFFIEIFDFKARCSAEKTVYEKFCVKARIYIICFDRQMIVMNLVCMHNLVKKRQNICFTYWNIPTLSLEVRKHEMTRISRDCNLLQHLIIFTLKLQFSNIIEYSYYKVFIMMQFTMFTSF